MSSIFLTPSVSRVCPEKSPSPPRERPSEALRRLLEATAALPVGRCRSRLPPRCGGGEASSPHDSPMSEECAMSCEEPLRADEGSGDESRSLP